MARSPLARWPLLPALLSTFAFAACAATPSTTPSRMPHVQLVHDVYFSLVDASPAAAQALVLDCYAKLAGIAGVAQLAAGTRDAELTRDVNDRGYDVSLHVWFTDRAAHDAYQTAPAHLAFIAANRANWRQVRVFDSTVRGEHPTR